MDVPEALGLENVMFFDAPRLIGVSCHRLAASSCFAWSSDLRICRPSAVDMINVKATRADTRIFLAPNILQSAATLFTPSFLFSDSIRGMIELASPGARAVILGWVVVVQVGSEMTVIRRASEAIPSIRWISYESLRRSNMWDFVSILEVL